MASVNTNYGALVAAQTLDATSRALTKTQNRVTSGMKVASAKDNGAVWAIAQTQRGSMMALDGTRQIQQRNQSINEVGLAAGDTIMAALNEMKALAAGPAGTSTTADLTALAAEITAARTNAVFDGVNALSGLTISLSGSSTATQINTAISTTIGVLQGLGTTSKSLERQIAFTNKLQDALEGGIGNLVDADLARESARLTALQTKQQLGVQALGIASSSSQILLGLFR